MLMVSNVDNLAASLDPRGVGAHCRGGKSVTVEVVRKEAGDRGGKRRDQHDYRLAHADPHLRNTPWIPPLISADRSAITSSGLMPPWVTR